MTMASSTFKDFIRNWQLFLVGLLLSLSPVLGANTTSSLNSTTALSTTASTTALATNTTTTATATTTPFNQSQSISQVPTSGATSLSPTVTAAVASGNTNPTSPTTTAMGSSNQSMSTSSGGPTSSSTLVSSLVTSSSGMNSSMSNGSNTTGSWSTGTTASNNSSMSTISCRSFMCNYSDCYSIYMSQNASQCPSGSNYCELMRQENMCYTVGCSASCSMSCSNSSQSNCSVNCCNSTNCLNDTFASMMMMTTSAPMTTTSRATTTLPTTTMTTPTTKAGKKCHKGKCNGTTCYTTFNTHEVCSTSQLHCHLKKETVGSNVQWTAGCTTNCSAETTCKASTQPPCFLECCNATVTSSCLFLNGTLNVPSFATRGPQLHTELLTSALLVFVISLML